MGRPRARLVRRSRYVPRVRFRESRRRRARSRRSTSDSSFGLPRAGKWSSEHGGYIPSSGTHTGIRMARLDAEVEIERRMGKVSREKARTHATLRIRDTRAKE